MTAPLPDRAPLPELRALTGARGIAAWMVVLYHLRLSIADLPPVVEAVLAKGYLAVDFFFLLSGFVIWLAWHDRFATAGLRAIPVFLRKRVARVWPLHLFVLAGGVALALLLAATGRHDPAEFPFADLPLHILLVQCWGFADAMTWNDPAWSISAEFAAYLAFPLLAIAIDWRRVPTWGAVATVAALILLLAAIMAAGGHDTFKHDIPRYGLIRCLIEFAAGTAIGGLWWRWRAAPRMPATVAAATAAIAFTLFATGLLRETIAAPLSFAALLLLLALTAGRRHHPFENHAIHTLGDWSYATYLGHFLLWTAFKLAFVTDATAVPWWQVVAYLALVLASSALLYRHVERPAQAWINSPARGRRRRPVPAG